MGKRISEGLKAKYEYIKEYNRANYDQLKIHVPKGDRERIKNGAERRHLSMAKYLILSIDEYEANHPL